MCGRFNSYLNTWDIMAKARRKNAGEVRIHLCAWCLCVDVRFLVFSGSLPIESAANHPGLGLHSLFAPEMSTASTCFSAEASSLQPFCHQPQAAARRVLLRVLILLCQNKALVVLF